MCLKSVSLQSFFVRFCMREHLTVCVCVCHLSPCLTVCFPVTVCLFSTCVVWYFLVSRRARVRVRTVFAWGALDSILVSSNQQTVERDAAQGWGGGERETHTSTYCAHAPQSTHGKSLTRDSSPPPLLPPLLKTSICWKCGWEQKFKLFSR